MTAARATSPISSGSRCRCRPRSIRRRSPPSRTAATTFPTCISRWPCTAAAGSRSTPPPTSAPTAARAIPSRARNTTRKGLSGLGENDTEKWFTDPRLRGLDQLPDKFFTKDRQAFDKGHLVRRDDVAWGETFDELRIANGDTYHVTNCSPQVAGFNRAHGGDNWGDLEKAVLAQAVDQRLTVLAGPILADDDPDFAGVDEAGAVRVQIPQAYWKVVVAPRSDDVGDGLAAFGFLLEQDLSAVDMERLDFDPRWTAQMRTLSELERLIRFLTFPEILHRADRHGTAAAEIRRRRRRAVRGGGVSTENEPRYP